MTTPDDEQNAVLDHAMRMLRAVVAEDHADVRRRGGSDADLLREAMLQALMATLWMQSVLDELTDLGLVNRSDVFRRAGDRMINHATTVAATLRQQRQAQTETKGEA